MFIQKLFLPLHSQSRMIATISRSGAVVARWAHNPKVVSSSLASATIQRLFLSKRQPFSFFMRSLPSSPSSRRRTEYSFFANFVVKKKAFWRPPGYQILIFFFACAYIYYALQKKNSICSPFAKKQRDLCKISVARCSKFRCPCR